jgi:NADPH:quinone reductase-like Zn-dependent oxidoreductase
LSMIERIRLPEINLVAGDMKLVSPKTPYTLGFDVSGVVVKVGDACKRLKVRRAIHPCNPAAHNLHTDWHMCT